MLDGAGGVPGKLLNPSAVLPVWGLQLSTSALTYAALHAPFHSLQAAAAEAEHAKLCAANQELDSRLQAVMSEVGRARPFALWCGGVLLLMLLCCTVRGQPESRTAVTAPPPCSRQLTQRNQVRDPKQTFHRDLPSLWLDCASCAQINGPSASCPSFPAHAL